MTARKPAPTTCCVPGCDLPRHEITSRNKSRFCDAHYRTRDQRLQTCTTPKSVTTDDALDTLHALRPPKPKREYPLTSGKWETSMAQYALLSEARKRADALVKRRGGRRRARVLDEAGRERAMARLAELLGETAEGAA